MFITEKDYIAGQFRCAENHPASHTRKPAYSQRRAMDRITSYLGGRYDMKAAFSEAGENRNYDLVGLVADLALYFMVLSLPQKMGYEIRKEQFEKAVAYLEKVQAGKAVINFPGTPAFRR